MNLDGKAFPDPHPAWGVCADELLFHTSRYATYTARRLNELARGRAADFTGFQASRMDPSQRACMAKLLSRPPSPGTARAVSELAAAAAAGCPGVPSVVRRFVGGCAAGPHMQVLGSRPRYSTGLREVAPTDLLRHLGRRYGFGVRIQGRGVWLDSGRFEHALAFGNGRVHQNLQEVLELLGRAGYVVHRRRVPWNVLRRA